MTVLCVPYWLDSAPWCDGGRATKHPSTPSAFGRAREGEREQERARERERKKKRERERGRERQTDRQTYRQTGRQTEPERERETDRQTDRQSDRARERVREREGLKAPWSGGIEGESGVGALPCPHARERGERRERERERERESVCVCVCVCEGGVEGTLEWRRLKVRVALVLSRVPTMLSSTRADPPRNT